MTIRTDLPYRNFSELFLAEKPVSRIDPIKNAKFFMAEDLQPSVDQEVVDRVFAELLHYKEERADKLEQLRIQATFSYQAKVFFHRVWAAVIHVFASLVNFFRRFFCAKEALNIPVPPSPLPVNDPGKLARVEERVRIKHLDEAYRLPLREVRGIRFQPNLLVNLRWHDLRNYAKETYVTLNKFGNVIAESAQANPAEKYEIFGEMLKATYGERLSSIVLRHSLHDKAFSPEKGITIGAIREAIVLAAASVHVDDLKGLYEQAKAFAASDNRDMLVWGVARMIPEDKLKELGSVDTFEALTASELKVLVGAFRKIWVFGEKRPLPVLHALFNKSEMSTLTSCAERFWFNESVKLLAGFEVLEKVPIKEHHAAIVSEFFAKHAAYRRLFPGMILPGRTAEGRSDFYICEGRLSSAAQKEVFSTLWSSWTHPQEAHLIFRGTQFHADVEGSGTSVIQNTDYDGIARNAFLRHAGNLLKMLEMHMRHKGMKSFMIHGHSQGAALAQRMLVSAIVHASKKENEILWKDVASFSMFGHNAPAVEAPSNLSLGVALTALNAAREIPVKAEVNYVHFSASTGPDVVQQQGSQFLGQGLTDLTTTVYYFRDPTLTPPPFYLHNARGWLANAPHTFELSVARTKDELADFFARTWSAALADWTLPVLKVPFYAGAYAALTVTSTVTEVWSRFRGIPEHPVHAYDRELGDTPFFMRHRFTALSTVSSVSDATIDIAEEGRSSPRGISVVAVAGSGAAGAGAPLAAAQ